MVQKKGLGKGLDAFFGSDQEERRPEQGIFEVDINKIEPNRDQPRKRFDDESLNELANSIAEFGLIQPLVVKDETTFYSIIAGERRWRAARIAKLQKVPVVVKNYSDLEVIEAALIENIQRANLNPIEEATTYERFVEEYNMTQDQIAQKVGKSRAAVTNALRLLALDKRVQNFIIENKITMGHARALLPMEADLQFELAERIMEERLSVREIETIVRDLLAAPKQEETEPIATPKKARDPLYQSIEADLKTILGTKVNIKNGKNKGKIEIEYYNEEELDRILILFRAMNP